MNKVTIPTSQAHRAIKALIQSNAGKFFSVSFIKKDGTERTLTGCKLIPKGKYKGQNTTAHIEKYLTVESSEGPRNVNMETLRKVSMGGVVINFEQASQ